MARDSAQPTPRTRTVALVVGSLLVVGAVVYALAGRRERSDEPAAAGDVVDPPTLAGAIAKARPLMTDTPHEMSAGTLIMIGWSTRHLLWRDVDVARNETSYALAQSDINAQRGKRLCVTGKIAELAPVRTDVATYNHGRLDAPGGETYTFFAIWSIGDLAAGADARFCGVVTGRNDVADDLLGPARAVIAVGMFDLADNRALGQGASAPTN